MRRAREDTPRDVVTVFIPEYVVGHWWEQILHNQSALRLKGRLLFTPGVMVTSVPWQLTSSTVVAARIRQDEDAADREADAEAAAIARAAREDHSSQWSGDATRSRHDR